MAKLRTIALVTALTLGACGGQPTESGAADSPEAQDASTVPAPSDSEPPAALPVVDSNDESRTTTSQAAEATTSTNAAEAPQLTTSSESPETSVQFLETVFGPWELSPDLEHAVREAFVDSDHALTSGTIFVSLRGTPRLADTDSTAAFSAWADADGGAVLAEFIQTTRVEPDSSSEDVQLIELRNVELVSVGQLEGKCSLNTLTPLPSFFECDVG